MCYYYEVKEAKAPANKKSNQVILFQSPNSYLTSY